MGVVIFYFIIDIIFLFRDLGCKKIIRPPQNTLNASIKSDSFYHIIDRRRKKKIKQMTTK
jgi:hypothetical protein